jgi:hypothetical protein
MSQSKDRTRTLTTKQLIIEGQPTDLDYNAEIIIDNSQFYIRNLKTKENLVLVNDISCSSIQSDSVSTTTLYVSGDTTLGNNLTVSGNTTLGNEPVDTVQITGSLSLSGGINYIYGNVQVTGTLSATDLDLVFNPVSYDVSSGITTGGTVVSSSNTTIDISGGTGQIISQSIVNGKISTIVTPVSWSAISNQTLPLSASSLFSYVYIDENGTLQQQATSFTDEQYKTKIPLATICHIDNTNINLVTNVQKTAYSDSSRLLNLYSTLGPVKKDGLQISAYSTDLRLQRNSGQVLKIGSNYTGSQFQPDIIDLSAASPALVCRVYASASSYVFDTNAGSFYTNFDPTKYNPNIGTNITSSINNNQWAVQRLFTFPNNPQDIICYYGPRIYNSKTEALNNITLETFSESTITRENAVFLGYVVHRGGAADLSNIDDAVFIEGGIIRNLAAGGASAPTTINLDDIANVSASAPANGDIISYNSSTLLWESTSNLSLSGTLQVTGSSYFKENIIMDSGKGISFAASSNLAGMTSEVLDDYEEGTFSPTIIWDGVTGTTLSGSYVKVGRIVHFEIASFSVPATTSSAAGSIRISGLPFAVDNFSYSYQAFFPSLYVNTNITGSRIPIYSAAGTDEVIWSYGYNTTGGGQQTALWSFTSGSTYLVRQTGTYATTA